LRLAQPWALGLAIHDLLSSSVHGLLVLSVQHVAYLLVAAWRRTYDTFVFTRIYAALAAAVVLDQRRRRVAVSRIAARSALAREIVDFYERDIPFLVQCAYSVVGASIMLTLTDSLLLPCCLTLLVGVAGVSILVRRTTDRFNASLNDELEREVEFISRGAAPDIQGHYRRVAHWRVLLANWMAVVFGLMELLVLGLTALVLVRACLRDGNDAGRISATIGYVSMFVMGAANIPQLVQQLGRLRDINRRMGSAGEDDRAPKFCGHKPARQR
jgi:hypothetical protein